MWVVSKIYLEMLVLRAIPDDLGNMNIPRYRLGKQWMKEYHRYFPVSAPEEDYDDRNLLYGMCVPIVTTCTVLGC